MDEPATPGDEGPSELGALDRLLLEVLEAAPEERPALLERLCEHHPDQAGALRRRVGLLREGGFVEESSPQSSELPERFGEYHILAELGGGGMGVVYLAEQESLGRRVALKLIRPEHLHFPRARERFRREVLAASRLEHPGICPVYEAGEVDGVPYIAMRHLDGETLAQRIARARGGAPHDVMETVELCERLARALHVAHEAGLVHRDLKPANAMVTREGEPVLLDFGLAHDESADQQLTRTGDVVGTPAYMAPEQIAGKGAGLDRRSDIYALGATLYECLTLRCPFEAPSREELYRQILGSDPVNPRRFNPRVPADLRAVLEKAMEKDPRRRYATAAELAEELRRVRLHEPVRARSAGPLLRARRWMQRHPLPTAIMALLFIGLGLSLYLMREITLREAQTEEELKHNQALAIARDAAEALEDDPRRALRLALEGVAIEQRPETLSEVHRALAAQHERRTFRHRGVVFSIQLARDGRRLLSASHDWTARIWDLEGGEEPLVTFEGHGQPVLSAVFSPDEEYVLTASWDGTARLWKPDGTLIHTYPHDHQVESAVFSPNGPLEVLTGCWDGCARLWSLEGEEPHVKFHHEGSVHAQFSPDGERVLTHSWSWSIARSGGDCCAKLWTRTGEWVADLPHEGGVPHVAFSPSGGRILTVSMDGAAKLWDCDGQLIKILEGHGGAVAFGAFSPDGKWIVTTSTDQTARLWSAEGEFLNVLRGHGDWVQSAVFLEIEDLTLIATGGGDQTVRVWTLGGREVAVLRGHRAGEALMSLEHVPGSFPPRLVSGSKDRTIRLWQLWDLELPLFLGCENEIRRAEVSPDGERVGAITWEGEVQIWDRWGRPIQSFRPLQEPAFWIEFSPDGRRLACAGEGETQVWDLEGDELLWRKTLDGLVWRASFLPPDGKRLLVHRASKCPRIFDLEQIGEQEGKDMKFPAPVFSVLTGLCFSPSGGEFLTLHSHGYALRWRRGGEPLGILAGHDSWIGGLYHPSRDLRLTFGGDGKMILWDGSNREVRIFPGTGYAVRSVAFSPSGEHLVSGRPDGSAWLWNLEAEHIATLRGHRRGVRVAFSPKGERILTYSEDGTARFWFADTDDLLAYARSKDTHVLAPEKVASNHGQGYMEYAWALHARERLREALAAYRRAIELDERGRPFAMLPIGQIHWILGEYEEAIAAYREDVAYDPDNWEKQNNFAFRLVRADTPPALREPEEARRVIEDVIRKRPGDPHPVHLKTLGVVLYRLGDCHRALEKLAEAYDSDDIRNDLRAIIAAYLSLCERQLGNEEPARAFLAQAREHLAQAPGDSHARAAVAEAER